jgi:hypothetical protein
MFPYVDAIPKARGNTKVREPYPRPTKLINFRKKKQVKTQD